MASLSELLNPTPLAKREPSGSDDNLANGDDVAMADAGFDQELFQLNSEDDTDVKFGGDHQHDRSVESPNDAIRRMSTSESLQDGPANNETPVDSTMRAPTVKPSKRAADKKDPRHSAKNEGQHTDRRYLCYLCNKLFTRRRSVRDHLAKIHNTKTWEPARSLEIIVEPESGEPIEPLEAQIAKGGSAPAPPPRANKRARAEEEPTQEEPESETEAEKPAETQAVKIEQSNNEARAGSVEVTAPAPVVSKKRPFPINKKGMAKVKSATPNKRPRLAESESRTPIRSPSVASIQRAPVTKLRKATESPSSSRAQSVDVSESGTSSAGTPGSTNDDGEVFCVCRKGDNHTWMIACDGGCEEWYHGRCVDIRERDGELIDKYVCPKCTSAGYHTTWKRMCRRKGCRKPARIFEYPPSKYCGRECGRLFFVDLIKRQNEEVQTTGKGQFIVEMEKPKKKRKRRQKAEKKKRVPGDVTPLIEGSRPHTPSYSDDEKSEYETDSSVDEDMLPNRGGVLRAAEVRSVLDQCKTVEAWRELGRKPATPPSDPDAMDVVTRKENLDGFDRDKLNEIKKLKLILIDRTEMLVAREALLELIKKRSTAISEEVKKANPKQKDICGFDPRLAWSEAEFTKWWKSEGGASLLQSGKIGPPASAEDENMTNGHVMSDDQDQDASGNSMPTKGGICVKNRCQRHGSSRWQKGQLAELRFEQDLVRRGMEKLGQQEREIQHQLVVRSWSKTA